MSLDVTTSEYYDKIMIHITNAGTDSDLPLVRKLVFLSDVPGVLRDPADPSSLIPTIHIGEIDHLAEDGVISGGMLPKLHSAAEAIRAGVGQVFLIDGRTPHSLLLEFFTVQGTGTMVVPD